MLFDLPDRSSLYDALLARDAAYDGRVASASPVRASFVD